MKHDGTQDLPVAVFTSAEWAEPPDMDSPARAALANHHWGFIAAAMFGGIVLGWLLASPSVTTHEPEVATTIAVAPRPDDLRLTDEELAAVVSAQDPVVVVTPELAEIELQITLAPREIAPGRAFSFWHLNDGRLTVEASDEALRPIFPKNTTVLVEEDDDDAAKLIVTDDSIFSIDRPTAETSVQYSGGISESGEYVYVHYDVSTTALPEPELVVYEVKSGKAIVKMAIADGLGTIRWIGDDQLAFVERVGAQQHLRIFDAEAKQAITVATMTGAVAWAMSVN